MTSTLDLTLDEIAYKLVDPEFYADENAFHQAMAVLRSQAPVIRVDQNPRYKPFWAITTHADVLRVERDNVQWTNAPRAILETSAIGERLRALSAENGNLINFDGSHHRAMRAIAAGWFRPKAMRELEARVRELAKRYVDVMADSSECEFVDDIAVAFPGHVILSLLGLPEQDFPLLQRWTREMFGLNDDDARRGDGSEDMADVLADFNAYFTEVTSRRRANPGADLASAIANANVEGRPLTYPEAASYYRIIATAGHDTTKAAIAGGLLALIENPEQCHRLRRTSELMPSAVEEIIRWTTPVKTFMRTASSDTVLHDMPIPARSAVAMIYPAANRDPAVFHDPNTFDVGRAENKHLGFGAGAHFCLGATLARLEITAFFEELIPRLETIELSGAPRHLPTLFVGGLKRLPVRYRLR
ncbi:cytochrome P450 [Mycolicibacterium mageritense]